MVSAESRTSASLGSANAVKVVVRLAIALVRMTIVSMNRWT